MNIKKIFLGSIPFYWRMKNAIDAPPFGIPERLNFKFDLNKDIGLLIQEKSAEVSYWLDKVYREDSNLGYLQEGHDLAGIYGSDFLNFIKSIQNDFSIEIKSALDIGCGGTYLLKALKSSGISVMGIDPSPVTAKVAASEGITYTTDFYPSKQLVDNYDLIFHYDVLEHISDPVSFLKTHHNNLSANGVIIIAVPDCTKSIKMGDVSMAIHEHLNYFDENSFRNVVKLAGFDPLIIKKAPNGGVLFCAAIKISMHTNHEKLIIDYQSKYDNFVSNAERSLLNFKKIYSSFGNEEIGIYIPVRLFPYLTSVGRVDRLRFFDDDAGVHKKYYDGFSASVENFSDLEKNPPRILIIGSLVYEEKIRQKLQKHNLPIPRILALKDFLVNNEN